MARRFFAPVDRRPPSPTDGAFRVTAVNDTAAPGHRRPSTLPRRRAGRHAPARSPPPPPRSAPTPPQRSPTSRSTRLADGEVLAFHWTRLGRHRRRRRRPAVRPKAPRPAATRRSPSTTTVDGGRLRARVTAEALALYVTLEADRPGRFSDQRRRASFPASTPRSPSPPTDGDPAGRHPHRPRPLHELRLHPKGAPDDRLLLPALQLAQLPAPRRHAEDAEAPSATRSVEGYGALYADEAKVAELKAHLGDSGLTMPTGHFGLDMVEGDPVWTLDIAKALGVETIDVTLISCPDQRSDSGAGLG